METNIIKLSPNVHLHLLLRIRRGTSETHLYFIVSHRLIELARLIKSIFHKNRAFSDTSMNFGTEAQNTQLF